MMELRTLLSEEDEAKARQCHLLVLDDLADWPQKLPFEGGRFSLLMVKDDRDVSAQTHWAWQVFADRVLGQGLSYFCTWGPDCEALHDLMDQSLIGRGVMDDDDERFVVTTWEAEDDLESELEFLKIGAFNLSSQNALPPCLVALVGRPDLVARVEAFPWTSPAA